MSTFNLVVFDIKALSYLGTSLCIPCGTWLFNQVATASFRSSSFAKRLPTKMLLHFWKQEKIRGARSGMYGIIATDISTHQVTRFDGQLHEATFQHHTEHQKLMIGYNKTGARTVCANVLYYLDDPRIFNVNIKICTI